MSIGKVYSRKLLPTNMTDKAVTLDTSVEMQQTNLSE